MKCSTSILKIMGAFALMAVLCTPILSAAATAERTLTLEECITLAEANHPSLEEARANLAVQQAKMGQVKSDNALKGTLSAGGARRTGSDESYSATFSVSKLLTDSGKNALERKSQALSIDSATESSREALLALHKNVKDAYYGLLLAILKRDQALSAVQTYQKHLEQARGFYEAGARALFDVTKAEVDLSSAKIDLVTAEKVLGTARAGISLAVGVDLEEVRPATDFRPVQPLPEEDFALNQAFQNRPDIRTARLRSEAGKLSVSLAAKGNAATVSLSGSSSLAGTDLSPDDSFALSLNLSVPVFDGGLTESRVSEARAALSATEAAGKQTGQTIRFEVRASLLAVREAEARISAAELLVRQAEENLTLAEGRYETGVGSVLEVADATLAANSSKVSLYQARADYSTSLAALEKTLGGEFQ